jgi:hypothetical protein
MPLRTSPASSVHTSELGPDFKRTHARSTQGLYIVDEATINFLEAPDTAFIADFAELWKRVAADFQVTYEARVRRIQRSKAGIKLEYSIKGGKVYHKSCDKLIVALPPVLDNLGAFKLSTCVCGVCVFRGEGGRWGEMGGGGACVGLCECMVCTRTHRYASSLVSSSWPNRRERAVFSRVRAEEYYSGLMLLKNAPQTVAGNFLQLLDVKIFP